MNLPELAVVEPIKTALPVSYIKLLPTEVPLGVSLPT